MLSEFTLHKMKPKIWEQILCQALLKLVLRFDLSWAPGISGNAWTHFFPRFLRDHDIDMKETRTTVRPVINYENTHHMSDTLPRAFCMYLLIYSHTNLTAWILSSSPFYG